MNTQPRRASRCSPLQLAAVLRAYANWFSGVPDSDFAATINGLPNWHFSPRENHSVAMAFGAKLGGARPAVMIQNSGLGLCLDVIAGTFILHKMPLLLLVSNRGTLEWEEPQHHHWGRNTTSLLLSFGIPVVDFDALGLDGIRIADSEARASQVPVAVTFERGNISAD